jgi:hypothetical protein
MQLRCSLGLALFIMLDVGAGCASRSPPDLMLTEGRCDSVPAPLTRDERRGGALPRATSILPEAGLVLGVVTEAQSGRVLASAGVSLLQGAGAERTRVGPEVLTDSAGGFVLGPQAPGQYTLRVRKMQHVLEERPLEVRAGVVDTVRITMRYFRCVGY